MKLNLKSYKLQKNKTYLKRNAIFFLFNATNLNSKNWLKIEQIFYNYNLKSYKISNTLMKKSVKKSLLFNTAQLINSTVCFISFKKNNNVKVDIQKIVKLHPSMTFLGLKLENKIYVLPQICKVSTINYIKNIEILNKSLKKLLKFPYYKLHN